MKSILFALLFFCGVAVFAQTTVKNWSADMHNGMLTVTLFVPEHQYLYQEQTRPLVHAGKDGLPVKPASEPKAAAHDDPFSGKVMIYAGPAVFRWTYDTSALETPVKVTAEWSGCREKTDDAEAICFMPGEAELAVFNERGSIAAAQSAPEPSAAYVSPDLPEYLVLRSTSGYLDAGQLINFLSGRHDGAFSFAGRSVLAIVFLALLGGLALNLTPCVLPLIPVNLAIIGATGSRAKGRADQILRGTAYGLGIALTYGALGIFVVLTGSTFGQIDANPIFNAVTAVVFLLLGLAMFDVFFLDFSRFKSQVHKPSATHYWGVFLMGCLSALLAGACVAPVLVAALIQASALYNQGNYAGLFLPFLLGVGMALPWPFAAAGLSLFPKPGGWMVHVKHVLGVFIILLGVYYAYTAWNIASENRAAKSAENPGDATDPVRELREALRESQRTGKPVLVDFWATWCKNCKLMEMKTFQDKEVKNALKDVIVLKLQTENPSREPAASLLKEFGVVGLPSMVLITAGRTPQAE